MKALLFIFIVLPLLAMIIYVAGGAVALRLDGNVPHPAPQMWFLVEVERVMNAVGTSPSVQAYFVRPAGFSTGLPTGAEMAADIATYNAQIKYNREWLDSLERAEIEGVGCATLGVVLLLASLALIRHITVRAKARAAGRKIVRSRWQRNKNASAFLLLAAVAAYLGGAMLALACSSEFNYSGSAWVLIEIERVMNFLHAPLSVQQWFSVLTRHNTGAAFAAAESNFDQINHTQQVIITDLNQAEGIGVIAAVVTVFLSVLIMHHMRKREADAPARNLARATRAPRVHRRQQIELCGVPLPIEMESRGLLMAGPPGTGKSLVNQSLLSQIRARGDSAVVVDYRGELMQRFWRPGDPMLNPFDVRGVCASPLAEYETNFELGKL